MDSATGPIFMVSVAWWATLAASALGCGLNAFLLLATIARRCRRRGGNSGRTNNGLLILAGAEIALTMTLAVHLLLRQTGGPVSLESAFHSLHVARNWWLLALTACRTAAVLKPFSSGGAVGRAGGLCRLGCRWQILVVSVIVAAGVGFVCASERLVTSGHFDGGGLPGANATQSESLQLGLIRFAMMAAVGTVAPGVCIAGLGTRTALALRRQAFHHPSMRRSCRMVLLLSLGFAALEFPFAGLQLVTIGRFLTAFDAGDAMEAQALVAELTKLEVAADWGLACVPVNSCLNFGVLLLCSRTFRADVCCCNCWDGGAAAAAAVTAAAAAAAATTGAAAARPSPISPEIEIRCPLRGNSSLNSKNAPRADSPRCLTEVVTTTA